MSEAKANDVSVGLQRRRIGLLDYYKQNTTKQTPTERKIKKEDPEESLKDILKSQSLNELLKTDISLRKEVKQLDENMKLLVFDNYNKFITAESTIKQMREKVEVMEEEMTRLSSNIERITMDSDSINDALQSKKKRIDMLLGVHKLLQKLQFLVDLPKKMKDAVQNGKYSEAVNYYNITYTVLEKYKHIPSFNPISRQCDTIIAELKSLLEREFYQEDVELSMLIEYGSLLSRLSPSAVDINVPTRLIAKFTDAVLEEIQQVQDEEADRRIRVLASHYDLVLNNIASLCEGKDNADAISESLRNNNVNEAFAEGILRMKKDGVKNVQQYSFVYILTLLDFHAKDLLEKIDGRFDEVLETFLNESIITPDFLEKFNPSQFQEIIFNHLLKIKVLLRLSDLSDLSENDVVGAIPGVLKKVIRRIVERFTSFSEQHLKKKGCSAFLLMSPIIFNSLIEFTKTVYPNMSEALSYEINPQGNLKPAELENYLAQATKSTLTHYVKKYGLLVGQMFAAYIECQNWITKKEPQYVENAITTISSEFISIERDLSLCIDFWNKKGFKASNSRSKSHARKESQTESRFNSFLQRKVDYFGEIEYNSKGIFSSILRRSLKTLLESVRLSTFSMYGFQQVHLDMYYLNKELNSILVDPESLDLIIEDILASVKERCLDPKLINEHVLENIYESMQI